MDGYDLFVIDIYPCDRPQLVRELSIEYRGVVERETVVVVKLRVFPRSRVRSFGCEFPGVIVSFSCRHPIVSQCIAV